MPHVTKRRCGCAVSGCLADWLKEAPLTQKQTRALVSSFRCQRGFAACVAAISIRDRFIFFSMTTNVKL